MSQLTSSEIENRVVRVIANILVDGHRDGITPELSLSDVIGYVQRELA